MQNVGHGRGSPLPGSSRDNLALSGSSTSASRTLSQENGDELESYLSIVAREGGEKQKQRTVVDWGKLLDSHGEEYHSDQEEGELDVRRSMEPDDAAAPIPFLKTQAKPQAEPGDSKQCTGIDSTRNNAQFPSQPNSLKALSKKKIGLNVSLVGSHMENDLADSVTLTDTTTTTEESWSENTTNILANTPTPSCNKRTDCIESSPLGGPDEQSETVHVYVDTKMDKRRPLASQRSVLPLMNEEDTVSIEEDSSDLSLPQNLFRNNLFTLDQLVAASAISTPDENTLHSSKEINVSPQQSPQPYEVQSLADLESLPGESKIELQSTHQMSAPGMHQTETEDRAAEESCSLNGRHLDHHISVVDTEDGKDSSSVSYEEDFESDTVQSNGSTRDLGDVATSLQAPAGEESTSDESDWEQTQTNSTYSSPQRHPKHMHHNTTDTTIHGTTDSDSIRHTCESGTMTEEFYLLGKPTSTCPTQPPLSTLHEHPHLHPSPLLPPMLTPSHVTALSNSALRSPTSVILQDLLQRQLALTRSLVSHSRSLAQQLSDSITPSYHYTTLEDTKKYISEHRPKVLSTEEAQLLVSQEENT